jgi:hypothetical protein
MSNPAKTNSTKGNGPIKSTTTSEGKQGQQYPSKPTSTSKGKQGQQYPGKPSTSSKGKQQGQQYPSTSTASNNGKGQGQQYPTKNSNPKGNAGKHDPMHRVGEIAKRYGEGKLPYGKTYKGKDGRSYKYDHCPQKLQHCMKPCSYRNWTKTCWLPKYGCSGYWCAESSNWYYWCEPRCCYLPTTYIEEYPSVEVEDCVEEVAPVEYQAPVTVASCEPTHVQTVTYTTTTTTTVTPTVTTTYTPVYKQVCEVPVRKTYEVPCQKPVYVPGTHVSHGGHGGQRPGYPPSSMKPQPHGQKYPAQQNGGQKGQKPGKW